MPQSNPPRKRPWQGTKAPRVKQGGRTEKESSLYHTAQWRATRKRLLQAEPLCRGCRKAGKVVVATVADHIKPVRQGGAFFDMENLSPLCLPCHAKKSGREAHE